MLLRCMDCVMICMGFFLTIQSHVSDQLILSLNVNKHYWIEFGGSQTNYVKKV